MKRTLERQINLGFGAAIAALLLIGSAAWWSATRFKGTVYWVNHSLEVRAELEHLHTEILSMQANVRGFVLTGDDSMLLPYERGNTRLDASLAHLRDLTADNPRQQARFAQLTPVVEEARLIMRDRIAARRTRGLDAAHETPFFVAGQKSVENLRNRITVMEEEERKLLADRFARMSSIAVLAVSSIALAVLLSVLLLLVAGRMLRRASRQRMEMEKAVREREERLQLMVSSVTDYAIILLDPAGRIVEWNPGASRIKGYTAEEITGRHFSTFYPPDALAAGLAQRALETAAREGRFQDEGWRLRKDGTLFWASVVVTALRDPDGKLVGFAKITRDLTERHEARKRIEVLNEDLTRRASQLEAANRELEAFSYSVSHDLRAPLRHIDGFAHLLERHTEKTADAESRRYLQTISRAATQMGNLIDDLLAFSRIGRTTLRIQPVDHAQLVREVLAEGRYPQSVAWDIADLPAGSGDRAMLRQVWANLIGNAVKYSSKNPQPRIAIAAHVDAAKEEHVYSVRDNGVGFNMAHADKLFGVFQRLHTPAEFEGTGIGLANVRRIVLRHGGRTWAEAKENEGATFYFSLPVTIVPPVSSE